MITSIKPWITRIARIVHHSTRTLQTSSGASSVSSNTVKVGDHHLHYVTKGSGPYTCLCLPGALGTGAGDFAPQLSGLAGETITLVAWDPPGYGKSRPPARNFTADFLHKDANLAAQMMQELGHSKYGVLGWSDGGITGIILAANNKQAVDKMVVWGVNAYLTQQDAEIYKGLRDVSNWSVRMRAPMEEMYGEEGFATIWTQWVDALIDIYKNKEGDLCKSECSEVQCPTLVVHGNKDAVVPMNHPKYFEEHMPVARVHYMEDGKHNLHMKYAKEFNKMALDFFTQN